MSLLTLIVATISKYVCIPNHHNVDHKFTHYLSIISQYSWGKIKECDFQSSGNSHKPPCPWFWNPSSLLEVVYNTH